MCRRRVGQHEVVLPRRGALHGIEDDRAGVGSLGPAHDLGAGALGPHGQLLGRRGAERVPRRQQHRLTGRGLAPGQLPDRRRLPHPVDTDEEPDVGVIRSPVEAQRPRPDGVEELADGRPQGLEQVVPPADLLGQHLGPQLVQEHAGRADADVGPDQRFFERLPGRLVDAARPQGGHGSTEEAPDAAEAAAVRGRRAERLRLGFRRDGRCGDRCRRRLGPRGRRSLWRRLRRRSRWRRGRAARALAGARERNPTESESQDSHRHDDDDQGADHVSGSSTSLSRAAAAAPASSAAATAAASSA